MIRRQALRLLGLGAAAGLAAACQLAPPSEPAPTNQVSPSPPVPTPTLVPTAMAVPPTEVPAPITSVRVAIDVDPDTLDPAGQTNATVSSIVDATVETLVRLQPDGTIAPGLARKWDV